MRAVIPGILWIGNAKDARDVTSVLNHGIEVVVDLAVEEPPILFPREIGYCRFPLIDGTGNSGAIILAAIRSIACVIRGGIPTLVACSGGMSRAPTIVAAAIAEHEDLPLHDVLTNGNLSGPIDISPAFLADVRQAIGEDSA